jgi:hypothetical protein
MASKIMRRGIAPSRGGALQRVNRKWRQRAASGEMAKAATAKRGMSKKDINENGENGGMAAA